jgi:hypothetical protein
MACLSLVVLLGATALSVDVGRLYVASQIAQNVADASAFAGGPLLRTPADAIQTAIATVAANGTTRGEYQIVCNYSEFGQTDIQYYPPGSNVPAVGVLGPYAKALRVTCHIPMPYTFARVLGLTTTTVTRQAIVVRAPVGGCPIAPMWVSHPTEYMYGEFQNLLMADGPHYAGIPGNFGWLEVPNDCTATWREVMQGDTLSDWNREALFQDLGDYVYGYPGLSVGQWVNGLEYRIEKANQAPWTGETFETCSQDNPRILIVPLVSYVSGTGSGATFLIEKFGAFWLDTVSAAGNPKRIGGRFIRYTLPGAGIDALSDDTGLFTYRLAG